MKCENCNSDHTGNYGSGRFCTAKCARGFSTKLKRAEINQTVSEKLSGRESTLSKEDRIAIAKKANAAKIARWHEKSRERLANLSFDELNNKEKRKKIFEEQSGCCSVCKLKEWNSQPITLELDHISGNRQNESRENLRLICPNCHSQTHTYKTKNVVNPGKIKFTDDEIAEVLLKGDSLYKVLIELGLNPHGGNYTRLRRIIKEKGIRQDLVF